MPNFKKFGVIFVIFENLNAKNRFFHKCAMPPVLRFCWRHPFAKKDFIFGMSMEKYGSSEMAHNFGQILGLQKGQKHPKSALSPTFLPHMKRIWEIPFLEGK